MLGLVLFITHSGPRAILLFVCTVWAWVILLICLHSLGLGYSVNLFTQSGPGIILLICLHSLGLVLFVYTVWAWGYSVNLFTQSGPRAILLFVYTVWVWGYSVICLHSLGLGLFC